MNNFKLPPLLGISGKKHSGKTSCAKIIKEYILPNNKVGIKNFADELKFQTVRALQVGVPNFTLEELEQNKEKYRGLLQWWGTDYRRNIFGKDYWINELTINILQPEQYDLIIIPDVRFYNELDWIKENGGQVIYINRPNIFHRDKHKSETESDDEYFIKQCLKIDNAFGVGKLPELILQLWNGQGLASKLNIKTPIA